MKTVQHNSDDLCSVPQNGATIVLPGQTPEGGHILSVLLKRSYNIVSNNMCVRAEDDVPIISGDLYWGDPMNSTIRHESDFVPYKQATDVVLNGKAYAPGGTPAVSCIASLEVGEIRKEILVTGNRKALFVKDDVPRFTEPLPFESMDLRYELAYGGIDVYSDKTTSYPYPRNPLGRGFVVSNTERCVDNLVLPNLEDPYDPLMPERLCLEGYQCWEQQPFPAGLGWFPKTWLPRAQLAGVMPADRTTEQELRQAYAQLLPADLHDIYLANRLPEMNFSFFNGASKGLVVSFLKGGEWITAGNLTPDGGISFQLPDDKPRIGLDIGNGIQGTDEVVHTVMIRMDDRQVDIVWRGAFPYPGPDWFPQMRKMEIFIY